MMRGVVEKVIVNRGSSPDNEGSVKHGASDQQRPNSPPLNLRIRYKLAEQLTVGNVNLKNAAKSYLNQKKTTDCLKNDVHRMKKYKSLKATQGNAQEIYQESRRELRQCYLTFVAAYQYLRKVVASGQLMKYRKQYKAAEKSLAQLSALISEADDTPAIPRTAEQQIGETEEKLRRHRSTTVERSNILNTTKQAGNEPAEVVRGESSSVDDKKEDSSEGEHSESDVGTESDTVDEGERDV